MDSVLTGFSPNLSVSLVDITSVVSSNVLAASLSFNIFIASLLVFMEFNVFILDILSQFL